MLRTLFSLALLAFAAPACSVSSARETSDPVVSNIDLSFMSKAVARGEHGRIQAVIVEQQGKILFEEYWRGSTAQSRIDARSVSKSITALAVGIAMDEGAIESLDLPVVDIIAGDARVMNDGQLKRSITLRDLLSMSSALDCNDWSSSSPGNEERMYSTDIWTRFAIDIPVDPAYARNEVGQGRFSYCTAGAFLLGRVVEAKTNFSFDSYVQRRLFDPLDIIGAEWTRSPIGEVQSGGQLKLSARDFQRIGRLVLDGGSVNGKHLISRKRLQTIIKPRVPAGGGLSYGYLWWFRNFTLPDEREISAALMMGNGGNMVVLFPETDTLVVILATNYNRRDMTEKSVALIRDYILPTLPEGGKAELFK
ncbi:serine hydrolase domain-containing protein [Arenibacterium sp. LLYu02]|uniref:serine hydrolase domain-containing protein n=1 Tax=Arenibacterium sp. LLYu02 TaxID=3404132 RepID=UPI003B21ECF7